MLRFNITYDTVTPESAEDGDFAESGFHAQGLTFREAMEEVRYWIGGHVEADSYCGTRPHRPRWFTFFGVDENYTTGAVTSYTLHLPESLSDASRMRIARLVGCYGANKAA